MDFIYSCHTDIGTAREVNQDSLVIKSATHGAHRFLLAAVCDGVGGLSRGEATSRKTAEMVSEWFDYELPQIADKLDEALVSCRCRLLINEINREVYYEALRRRDASGSTLSMLLAWDYHYLVCHVGDSRVYEITGTQRVLTTDHSWVAREMGLGHITPQEAANHPRKNVILKCIGAKEEIQPDLFGGRISGPTMFVLCTDGFWHYIRAGEWVQYLSPASVRDEGELGRRLYYLTEQVKVRGETDNITAVAIAVY